MPMRPPLLVAALLLPLLAACGEEAGVEARPSGAPTGDARDCFELPDPESIDDGGDVHFHVVGEDGEQVDLDWWTSCLSFPEEPGSSVSVSACADGAPPEEPVSVGSPAEVAFAFDLPGWRFREATFRPHGDLATDGTSTTRIERTSDRTYLVPAPDEPGDYDVDVFGRGPEGDAVTTFRWRVRTAG